MLEFPDVLYNPPSLLPPPRSYSVSTCPIVCVSLHQYLLVCSGLTTAARNWNDITTTTILNSNFRKFQKAVRIILLASILCELTGQGIQPPLSLLAFSVSLTPLWLSEDATDMVDALKGCWVIGTRFEDICAFGGRAGDELDWKDIASRW
jgi:hypothetical protein